ncbi:MAG: hypothetical protein LBU44_00130 [Mediterranea sp.]|jgi:hypothetical protein|nr:hypothetical protein [Mediterranea sp.]
MNFIIIPVTVGIITYGIYKLFELFVCRHERLKMIEKLGDDQFQFPSMPEGFQLPGFARPHTSYRALKGGLLLLGVGLGLFIGFIICATCIPDYFQDSGWHIGRIVTLIYGSCIFIFGGIGLLIAFVIELKIGKKKD